MVEPGSEEGRRNPTGRRGAGNRLDTIDRRQDAQDSLIDELRRGEGFILPLVRPPGS
jgi:hypothetical protein